MCPDVLVTYLPDRSWAPSSQERTEDRSNFPSNGDDRFVREFKCHERNRLLLSPCPKGSECQIANVLNQLESGLS
jgi:hypothetical protein